MVLSSRQTAYVQIHAAVLLFGFTAILGNLIELPAIVIVWWRVLITSVSLLFFIQFGKNLKKVTTKNVKTYSFIGLLIGLHWICFYGSIKLSNSSICLICMSTTSLFTSLLEPLINKRKFNKLELILGLCVVPGMILIVNNIHLEYIDGIWVGLASAFLAALFSILNKLNIKGADPYSITFIELTSAWIMVSILILFIGIMDFSPEKFIPQSFNDWFYIFILAILCTTVAHVLSLKALNHLSAFASNLVINLEPVYGILLAIILLNEHEKFSLWFYFGVTIILISVLTYPYLSNKFNRSTV